MRALVWFRADLRVADHRALHRACADADDGVVGVFTVCTQQWQEHDWGRSKVDFILRNLDALSKALEERNVPLKILSFPRFEGAPLALARLASSTRCDALYFNDEYEINERRRDDRVERRFEDRGLVVRRFTDQVLLEPGSVKTQQDDWYSVFTPFRRRWIDVFVERGDLEPLPRPRQTKTIEVVGDAIPDVTGKFSFGNPRPDLWPAGEAEATRRLERFAAGPIYRYSDRRDQPALPGTSTLSPYLAAGVLSPRQCIQAAMNSNEGRVGPGTSKPNGAETWIRELIWREFYKHLLVGVPRLSMARAFRAETERLQWRVAPEDYAAWCEGRTGFPIVDAAMRQLNQTGWMHNRLRMIVAMFLTKDLFLDWRLGERYFMRNLVDGDLAANNGGWQWSASTGTDAAPYFRIFNPTTQGERFDPNGEFIHRFVPELAGLVGKDLHEPSRLGERRLKELGYPRPVCDHNQARLHAISAFKALKSAPAR